MQAAISLEQDILWMREDIAVARKAQCMDEVPVGAVLVKEGGIIAHGWNQPISQSDPRAHAEILTLRAAGKHLSNYRLLDTTLRASCRPTDGFRFKDVN